MKKKSLYSFIMLMMLGVVSMIITSCKKYLTELPNASFSQQSAFSNVSNATDAVMGVYSELSGDQGYGIRLSMYYTVDADDFVGPPNSSAPDGDRRDIARYGANSSNAQIEKPWENLYLGIERANICIKYIPLMTAYTSGSATDQASLKRLYGEALTLRAQYYFELMRNWGDVPAQFVPSADQPTLIIPRTNRDVIYTQILADLLTAESLVPWRSAVVRDERITLGAVKGLRARIALFMGGYSLRNDTQVMSRRSDYLTYYQIALKECGDIIASGQHGLESSYINLFKSYVDAHTPDPTYEIIFEVGMGGGTGVADSKLGYYDGPKVGSNGNASLIPNATYFYAFDPVNDTRRDVTICTYFSNADGVTKTLQKLSAICSGKFRRDWITPAVSPTSLLQYFGIDWPILRYSDVLLMYAEADNEINNGPNATDISYFNQVRTRGYGGNAALIGTTPNTYAAFFTAIQNERELEFGAEGIRKFDLIRWNLFNTTITATRANMTLMLNKAAPYANLPQSMYYLPNQTTLIYGNSLTAVTPSATPTGYTKIAWVSAETAASIATIAQYFTPNHSELLPIPLPSLQANPLLTQNPGYQ